MDDRSGPLASVRWIGLHDQRRSHEASVISKIIARALQVYGAYVMRYLYGTEETMKPALLVVDMQKAYHAGPAAPSMDAACEYINAAAALFRKRGLPVVWIQNKDEYDKALPGLPGFDIVGELKPLENEPRRTKEYSNSLSKTDCKKILDSHSVDTVIVTGYAAEHCVLSTCRGARDLDLFSILLRGAIASSVPENIGFVQRI